MTHYFISCPNVDTQEQEHFEVPKSVYVYVIQLEHKIKESKAYNSVPHYTFYKVEDKQEW